MCTFFGTLHFLADVSIFLIFVRLRGGEGGVRGDREGGGSAFLIENPRGGGVGGSSRGGG